MTLASHWQSRVGEEKIPYLWYGVDIFFTISGFLITRILLQINHSKGKFIGLKNFYVRRALRLFPAYYLLTFAFFLALNFFNLYIWDNQWNAYYFLYLANWYWYLHPNSGSGSFNHIWSLGVEEQFYLVWPWLIAFLPVRYIKSFIIGCILTGLCLHFSLNSLPRSGMLPFFNLHTLGTGALLGYMYFQEPNNKCLKAAVKASSIILVVSLGTILYLLFRPPLSGGAYSLMVRLDLCILTGVLVLKSVYGWGKYSGLFFRNKYVQFIGTISYGIYLYHMPVPDTLKALVGKFGYPLDFKQHPVFYLLLFYVLTFLVALFSYKFLEMPFLRIKSKFPLGRAAAETKEPAEKVLMVRVRSKSVNNVYEKL